METDILVIGAGAAGIGAGIRLRDAALRFAIIEARSRVGGRADTQTVAGMPLDLGCGWLHSADRNPLTARAEATGFHVDRTPPSWGRQSTGAGFPAQDQTDFRSALDDFYDRVHDGLAAPDCAAVGMLLPDSRWNPLIDAVSTFANGAELAQVSAHDLARYADSGTNWRIDEGYGTAFAAWAAELPILLARTVTNVDHGRRPIRIDTSAGTIEAAAVIVTVPTPAIARGMIGFSPALPDKQAAAAALPLGVANKLFIGLDEPEALPANGHLFGRSDRRDTASYHLRPFGRPMIEVFFGGPLATALESDGLAGFYAFAADELAGVLGHAIRAKLKPLAASSWHADPLACGSYSHALPGHAEARAVLAATVGDALFFAGEACSPDWFSTAHGAWLSGVAAAERAIEALAARSG